MLTRLGKFEILRLLAQGSMGEVYVGRDPILGREVAIKVIHPSAGLGLDVRERFAREAQAAGRLNHPNIVTVHEMGEEQGVLFLAMELVKGDDLGTLIRSGTLAPKEALEILAQVCDGLAEAHRHKILHRDIKPSNIRVLREGKGLQAKVLDFGVAKVVNSDTTDAGTVFGTVNYMAPEYLHSGRPDVRSDLFAVGVVLHEALAGVPPFDGPTPGSVIYRVLHETPAPLPPSGLMGISKDVQLVLNHALAKDPAGRFQTAEELGSALRAALDPAWRWNQASLAPAPKPLWSPPVLDAPTPPTLSRGVPGLRPPVQPAEQGSTRFASDGAASQSPVRPVKARPEVRRDVLEATRLQLTQVLEGNPANTKAVALLLVTLYRLGHTDALMQVLRRARDARLLGSELRAVDRCEQMVREEEMACRLPLELHGEFLDYLSA